MRAHVEIEIEGGTVLLDVEDFQDLEGNAIRLHNTGYPVFGRWPHPAITLHSFVMGGTRLGLHIDHINRNKLDNRRANLRYVTPRENSVNAGAQATSGTGVRGIRYAPKQTLRPWKASIFARGKSHYLGSFATREEAIAARQAAELERYGQLCPQPKELT